MPAHPGGMNDTGGELAWKHLGDSRSTLHKYRDAGLEQLLTEDVVRLARPFAGCWPTPPLIALVASLF